MAKGRVHVKAHTRGRSHRKVEEAGEALVARPRHGDWIYSDRTAQFRVVSEYAISVLGADLT